MIDAPITISDINEEELIREYNDLLLYKERCLQMIATLNVNGSDSCFEDWSDIIYAAKRKYPNRED